MSLTALPPAPIPPTEQRPASTEDEWVLRFGRTERFAHWWTVLMLLVALLTGLSLGDESRSGVMFDAHVISVVLIALGLIAAATFGNHRALLSAAHQLFGFDKRDIGWLRSHVNHPFRRQAELASGMFNTGQKMLGWALALSVAAVIGTGILAWSAGGDGGGGLHGSAVVVTFILLAAHVFMAVINPSTRPALPGMVFGRVRRSWAAKHHGEWLDETGGKRRQ
jgi:formate dehydrogenase subunit gamma